MNNVPLIVALPAIVLTINIGGFIALWLFTVILRWATTMTSPLRILRQDLNVPGGFYGDVPRVKWWRTVGIGLVIWLTLWALALYTPIGQIPVRQSEPWEWE